MDGHHAGVLASLNAEQRAAYDRLLAQFKALHADDAAAWALREVQEGQPLLARFILLQRLSKWQIDDWQDDTSWVLGLYSAAHRNPTGWSAEASRALEHVWALGATPEELGAIARFVAANTVLGTLRALDEGADPDLGNAYPGWQLMETAGPDRALTGRRLGGLYEDLDALS